MRAFDEYAVDLVDLDPIEYRDCPHCGHSARGGGMCRRCGKLGRVLGRIEHTQIMIKLHLSLLKNGGSLDHLHAARWLTQWSTIWINAAQRIEGAM